MSILITGGLGYLGGRIACYINEKEPNTSIILGTRSKNKKLPSWTKKFAVQQINLLDEDSIVNCLSSKKIDTIIHLAAMNEIESFDDTLSALEVNTKATYSLLNLAKHYNTSRFVYFSTFHVYGKILSPIITEGTPTKPFHPYAITHRAAEDFVTYFNHYYGMKTLIFRLSNSYGYPMDKEVNRWSLVFNDLCKQIVTKGKIVLRSSGTQYRDFITLNDVARAVYHFLFRIPDKWEDGLYNIGGECNMSILDVANQISEIYSRKYNKKILEIERKQEKRHEEEIIRFNYCVDKLLKTGFYFKGDMEEEIIKTMEVCEDFIR